MHPSLAQATENWFIEEEERKKKNVSILAYYNINATHVQHIDIHNIKILPGHWQQPDSHDYVQPGPRSSPEPPISFKWAKNKTVQYNFIKYRCWF